ncbi:MAG: FHA domain-containing protein [Cellulomonas sp.]|nr:FHA domain-containing protein [Cellulomonas sp.]
MEESIRLAVRATGLERVLVSGDELTIGRAPTCDLRIPDPQVSRVHARIAFEAGTWVVRDPGSANGVHVNGYRLDAFSVDRPMTMVLGPADTGVQVELEPVNGLLPSPAACSPSVPESASSTPQQPRAISTVPGPSPISAVPGLERPRSGASVPASVPPGPRRTGQSAEFTVMRADLDRAELGGAVHEVTDLGLGRTVVGRFDLAAGVAGAGVATIGRDESCTIVVSDVLASRVHARVDLTVDGPVLTDLSSSNGTFLNGRRVARVWLADGDVVTVGNTDVVVRDGVLAARAAPAPDEARVRAEAVGLTIAGGKRLLDGITLDLQVGSLTAIVGPSGAGKTTFSRILTGQSAPTDGHVTFGGHDMHGDYDLVRSRIGFVPQNDVVHDKLSVDRAMDFSARLRLPEASEAERDAVVDRVLAELELTEHRRTRVDRLSGGQRKRVSTAIELLTGPELLVLDEPTSGLDPALDLTVMRMLRTLADAGRVVVVVTHSLVHLREICDNVLLLAPGGRTAYWGSVDRLGDAYGDRTWADIFAAVTRDPRGAAAEHLARRGAEPAAAHPQRTAPGPVARERSHALRQSATLVRRQFLLIAADPALLVFLVVLPLVLGGLALLVPGSAGFGRAAPTAATEPSQLLVLLVLGACFMGAALSIRDIVGERSIYQRERAVGLSPAAYVGSKLVVLCVATAMQSTLLAIVLRLGKPPPGHGVVVGDGMVELALVVWLTAWVSAMLGALVSAVVRSGEQTMPLLVIIVMTQLVMTGGMIPVTNRDGLSQVAALFPARWGYAAAASTVDLRHVVPVAQHDALWVHSVGQFWADVAVLVAMLVVLSVGVWLRVRRRRVRR